MTAHRAWRALATGIACGAAVWALSIPLAGVREPFDSGSAYYPVAMFLGGVVAAAASPRHWWLAVIGIFLGERLYGYAMLPEGRAWLLFGVVINALLLTWLPAAIGALGVYLLHRWQARRQQGGSANSEQRR